LERDNSDTTEPQIRLIFGWMAAQVRQRNPDAGKQVVLLMDGQESLWKAGRVWCQLSWPVSDNYLGRLAPLFFRGRVSYVLVWEGVPLVGPNTGRSP
jgi:hypothetical protein